MVQIDHTLVDLIVVHEETREPLARPWLTLAIDVFTRMITGFHLSMDPPSRLSVSLCVLHGVYDKTAWLEEREIDATWPVAGLPEAFRVDNGADFKAKLSFAVVAMKASISFGACLANRITAVISND